MATIDEIIASHDIEAIKRKRSSIVSMITIVTKGISRGLVRVNGEFDHSVISRVRIEDEYAKLLKFQNSFDTIHQAFMEYREINEDSALEEQSIEQDEIYYNKVVDKIYESLQLYSEYEKSYKLYKGALSVSQSDQNSALPEKENNSVVENKEQLRLVSVKAEQSFKEAFGKYKTIKDRAALLIEFAKDLSHEQLVDKVLQSASIRSLPVYDTVSTLKSRHFC